MNKQQKFIFEQMQDMNPDALKMDGYDDCIAGIVLGYKGSCLLYDMGKVIDKMMADGMTEDEAYEYFDYNVLGAWMGEFTPLFLAEINPTQHKTTLGGLWQRFRLKKK